MRVTSMLVFVLVVCSSLGAGPAQKKTYLLKYRPEVGQRVAYQQTMDVRLKFDGVNNYFKVSKSKAENFRSQLVVKDEEITSIDKEGNVNGKRMSFGPHSWWANQSDDKPPRKSRLVYADHVVNFKLDEHGQIEQDYGVKPSGDMMRVLRQSIQGREAVLPDRAVAVGEKWSSDQALRTVLDLRPEDNVSAFCQLKDVRVGAYGREVADVSLGAAVITKEKRFNFNLEMSLEGLFTFDVKTGVLVKAELGGKLNCAGAPGGNVHVTGGGTIAMTRVGKVLPNAREAAEAAIAEAGAR